jgi:uncharacterized protein (UPF0210 family)
MSRADFHSGTRGDLFETLRMVEVENFDIRTTTLGISLFDIAGSDAGLPDRVYNRILEYGGKLVETAQSVEADLGMPIINKRVSVTPVALVAGGGGPKLMVETAKALDAAAKDIGIDYIAGYSALVHKGISKGDAAYIESLPDAIVATERLCCSINVASTRAGINMDAIGLMGHTILEMAHRTADSDGVGCARFVVFSNAVEDNPFIAGAMHGVGEPQAVLNVGISGPGVVHSALKRLMQNPPPNMDLGNIADVIKRMAFKCI